MAMPVKPATIDRRDQNKQANAQKRPWPLSQISGFDKGTASPTRVSTPNDERQGQPALRPLARPATTEQEHRRMNAKRKGNRDEHRSISLLNKGRNQQ